MKRLFKNKKIIISLAACAVILAGIGSTYAILSVHSNDVTNTFTAEEINTHIEEKLDAENLGKDVKIQNDGPSDAFIRARVTVSPEGVASWEGMGDYWIDGGDGWYYYRMVIPKDELTSSLMQKVVVPDGFEGDFDVTVYQEAVGSGSYETHDVVPENEVSKIQALFAAINK